MPYSCKSGELLKLAAGLKAMFISFVKRKSPFDSMSHSGSMLQDAFSMYNLN